MRKIILGTAVAAAFLAGCAAPPPKMNSYTYTSEQHSGNVSVVEVFANGKTTCPSGWRESEQYQPTGLVKTDPDSLRLSIQASVASGGFEDISVVVPSGMSGKALWKDFQVTKDYMLGADTSGMVKQGEHFYFPEGYFVRATAPTFKGDKMSLCLAVDRMYVKESDLQTSVDPTIHLDRIVIPFVARPGQARTFVLNANQQVTLKVTGKPK